MNNDTVIAEVEKEIGYCFKDKNLLLEAITHSSYVNEMRINKRSDYERLEFLGDSVLELISSEFLYEKYPEVPEGGLSKKRASMVCEPSLAICARNMNFGKYIFFGKGEELAGGREKESILSDVVEAVLGGIYLDSGLEAAKEYVYVNILSSLQEEELFVDSKSALQELVSQGIGGSLEYEIVEESGPEHDKLFTMSVSLDGNELARGSGHTKKSAQQKAAKEAIKILKNQ